MAAKKFAALGNIPPVSASSQLMIDCGINSPRRWINIVPNAKIREDQQPLNQPDKIIQKLENFPELVQALRDGNQLRARLLFAQLFDGDNDDRRETRRTS